MKTVASLTLAAITLLAAAPPAHAQTAESKPTDSAGLAVPVEPTDVPEVHYPPPSTRFKLIGVGLLLTGAAWGTSFGVATNWPNVPGSAQLKIPIVGPWIALGKSGCSSDDPDCGAGTLGVRGALYVLDGIAQIAGLALIAEAIVMKTEPAGEKKATALPTLRFHGVEVSAVPVTSPTMKGIGLVGTF
ncbi:Hypothetical protein A7982_08273 [Minicystis rosea]|nr:Hypothetical protein A7982_08273 [Minicystis rosea]